MQQRAFPILLLAVFIDLLDFGLLVPILPLLLTDQSSPYLMLGPGQEDLGLLILGGLGATYGFTQFLASPLLGQLADRYGRKPLLLLSLTGTTLAYIILAVGVTINSILLLFVARMIDGGLGGYITVAQAALTDVTPEEQRAKRFGYFSGAISFGFVVGPLLGGFLSDSSLSPLFGITTPFWVAATLSGVDALLIWFLLAETLRERKQVKLTVTQAFRQVKAAFQDERLRSIYATTLLFTLGFGFFVSLFNVFLIQRFGFGARQVGLTVAGLGLSLFLVEVLLVEPAKQRFGSVRPLRVVLFAAGLTLLLIAFVNQLWHLVVLIPLFALCNGLTRPNLTALISRGAAPGDQGRRLGVNASVQALGQATPPLIAGSVAAATSTTIPIVLAGVSFLLAGVVFVRFYGERTVANAESGNAALARQSESIP